MALPTWMKLGGGGSTQPTQVASYTENTANPSLTATERMAFQNRASMLDGQVHIIALKNLHGPDTKTYFATNDENLRRELVKAAIDIKNRRFAEDVSILADRTEVSFRSIRNLRLQTDAVFAEDRKLKLPEELAARFVQGQKRINALMVGDKSPGFGTLDQPRLPRLLAFQAHLAAITPAVTPEHVGAVALQRVLARATQISSDIRGITEPPAAAPRVHSSRTAVHPEESPKLKLAVPPTPATSPEEKIRALTAEVEMLKKALSDKPASEEPAPTRVGRASALAAELEPVGAPSARVRP